MSTIDMIQHLDFLLMVRHFAAVRHTTRTYGDAMQMFVAMVLNRLYLIVHFAKKSNRKAM
jgi:hypothetical protein